MDNLERYLDQVMEQKPVVHDDPPSDGFPEEDSQPKPDLLGSIARRWYIVLAAAIVICGLGLPAIWMLVEPVFTVRGAVSVQPEVGLVTGDAAPTPRNDLFLAGEADTMRSDPDLHEDIAEYLVTRNLTFFSGEPQTLLEKIKARFTPTPRRTGVVERLRQAMADGTITITPVSSAGRLVVAMTSARPDEAMEIVNAFLTEYRSRYTIDMDDLRQESREQLEGKQLLLEGEMKGMRDEIREKAEAYGGAGIETVHAMKLSRQEDLLARLTALQLEQSRLEADLGRIDANGVQMSAEQLTALRTQTVNEDPDVVQLSQQIAEKRRELIELRVLRREGDRVLAQQEQILAELAAALDTKRRQLEQEFDINWENNRSVLADQQRATVQAELDQVRVSLAGIQSQFDAQEQETKAIGKTLDEIRMLRDELQAQQTLYQQVLARLQLIDVEGQGRPKVVIAYPASAGSADDKRMKFSAAVLFLGLGCGVGLALLKDKTDKTLQTPEDVSRQLDLPVLGTTSSSNTVKPSLFAEQIAADYQTIRTNLGLLTNGGIPRKLAVSSPGMREGKTTFAVNLATSLAKGGKRVLLIDGDLRKPDVRFMLNISNGAGTVQDVLTGAGDDKTVFKIPASGLHVLVASARRTTDVYELLASSRAAERIERLGREYDHVIIDTPPVLAFPDALIWARMAGAVVLVGFAGTTTGPELKEAKDKFSRVRVQVLGAILSNVRAEQGLYRYGYGYRAADIEPVRKARRKRKLLLSTETSKDTTKTQDA